MEFKPKQQVVSVVQNSISHNYLMSIRQHSKRLLLNYQLHLGLENGAAILSYLKFKAHLK